MEDRYRVAPDRSAQRGQHTLQRRLGVALASAGLLFIAVATLTPGRDPRGLALTTSLTCLVCGEQGGADVAANLLLFLPLAIGLRLAGVSWRRTVLLGALLSLTVELLQLGVVPGRDTSLSDLISNTISSAIGATVGAQLPGAVRPGPGRAARLLAGGIAAFLAILGISAWLLAPGLLDGRLLSAWAYPTPRTDVFGGSVTDVRLDGLPMPRIGAPPDPAALRQGLSRGQLTLDADIVTGPAARDRGWIYMLLAPSGSVLTLGQRHRAVGVAVPARALRFRLLPPVVALPDAFPASPGVPVHLKAVEDHRRIRLSSAYQGVERSISLGISPAYGWVLLDPVGVGTGTGVRWITGAGLALLLLPLGYWAAWTRRPVAAFGALGAALVAALGLLPAAAGFPPVHWSEWAAGLLGIAAGWALHRHAAYLQRRCASPSASESFSS
jgi:VanZ like protein